MLSTLIRSTVAFCVAVLVLVSPAAAQAPTDNPIAARYGASAYPWANQIKWNSVFSIADYGGVADGVTDNVGAFNAARDAAASAGGGVVYFPAGTYYFADSINLKTGVVVRGDTPTGIVDGKTDGYAPPTKLVFPTYVPSFTGSGTPNSTAFKCISTNDNLADSNIGLVNLDINRAVVKFGSTGVGFDQWYSGDWHAAPTNNSMKNVVVFGVRSNNAAEAQVGTPATYQNAWQRYSYDWTANFIVQPWRNALVGNNRVNDAPTDSYFQPGYKVAKGSPSTIVVFNGTTYSDPNGFAEFSYTDHYGIVAGKVGWPHPGDGNTPITDPAQFRPGINVRDNYVYTTMRIKVYAAGYGMNIQDNVLRDRNNKVIWCTSTGRYFQTDFSATYENRGIDIAGYDVTVSGNDAQIYRHWFPASGMSYASVDGEFILMQEWIGSLAVGEKIINNTGNSYIGIYKTKEIRNLLIEGNTLTNTAGNSTSATLIYVQANTNGATYPMYDVAIRNNTVNSGGNIRAIASKGGTNVEVSGNTGSGGQIYTSDFVSVHDNTGFTYSTLASTPTNRGPDVAVTSPTWLQNVPGVSAVLTASASDADGTVSKVEFYNQNVLIGTDTNGADGWSVNFSGLTYGGEYMVATKAYDNLNASWVSDPVYFAARMNGDANLDRYVDVVDLGLLATNYGKTLGAGWNLGDFNEDGVVDVVDLGLLATMYGHSAAAADAAVPEPGTCLLLAAGAFSAMRRKR